MANIKSDIKENKREFADVVYLVALQGLNFVAPLLVLPYLMIVLGAEKFGYISFALAVCQYFIVVIDFGFNLSTTKRIALVSGDKAAVSRIFAAACYSKIGLMLCCFVIMVALSYIPAFAIYRKALFAMFTIVVGNTFLYVFLFQGLGQIRWISVFNGIAKISVLPLTFVFVKSPDDYLIAAFLQGGVSVAAAIISICMIAKKHWVSLPRFNFSDCKTEMREGFYIFLSNVVNSVYVLGFMLILGLFATPAEVGRYSASDKIVRAFIAITMSPIIQAFYPKVSRMAANAWDKARQMVIRLMLLLLAAMIVFVAAVFVLAPFLPQWLGSDYTGTETMIRIMSVASIFICMGGIFGQLGLLAMGGKLQKKKFSNVYLLATLVAIVAVSILSPFYFGIGAAVAILITEVFVGVSMALRYGNMLKNHKLDELNKTPKVKYDALKEIPKVKPIQ